MTREEKKREQAVNILSDYCNKHYLCEECKFYNSECFFTEYIPGEWKENYHEKFN